MNKADARTLKASNFLLMAFKIPQKIKIPEITYLENQSIIGINGVDLTFIPVPGHTPGSCILQFGSAWFTGDTIYSQGVGLSSLPGEDAKKLKQSILEIWDQLLEDRNIFPGHGNPASSISIRKNNQALLRFLGFLEAKGELL
jgi:glyoxylase-like metal-dependent hydrolase (beta-lactamase superfamily II)